MYPTFTTMAPRRVMKVNVTKCTATSKQATVVSTRKARESKPQGYA